ncbi:MAG: MFS transporter [Saccharofermentanales bacterium]
MPKYELKSFTRRLTGKHYVVYEEKYIRLLFWSCFVAYFVTYIGRINYSAVMIEMIGEGILTKSTAGLIGTLTFFAYGAGQFLSGMAADRINPKYMMAAGLFLSGFLNLLMGSAADASVMLALWTMNGLVQSMTWAPIMKLFAERLPEDYRVRSSVNISGSSVLGTLATYLICSLSVALSSWRASFYIASGLMLAAAAGWLAVLTLIERHSVTDVTETRYPKEPPSLVSKGGKTALIRLIIPSGLLLIIVGAVAQGILKDGVTTWIPTYLSENFSVTSFAAIILMTILPVASLAGIYISAWLNRIAFKNESATAAFLFLLSGISLFVLFRWQCGAVLSTVLFSLSMAAMCGVNTMVVGLIPLYFARFHRSAGVSGLLNSFVYLGGALSVYGIGVISEKHGWGFTVMLWIVLAASGGLAFLASIRLWNRFKGYRDPSLSGPS